MGFKPLFLHDKIIIRTIRSFPLRLIILVDLKNRVILLFLLVFDAVTTCCCAFLYIVEMLVTFHFKS